MHSRAPTRAPRVSLHGGCRCNNLRVTWRTTDYSVVPRACQCDYCRANSATWVSKSGTAIELRILDESLHSVVTQGSRSAEFHECGGCGELVLVTARIDGEVYGALNAKRVDNRFGFAPAVAIDYAGQTAEQKRQRWRDNWCSPVRVAR